MKCQDRTEKDRTGKDPVQVEDWGFAAPETMPTTKPRILEFPAEWAEEWGAEWAVVRVVD